VKLPRFIQVAAIANIRFRHLIQDPRAVGSKLLSVSKSRLALLHAAPLGKIRSQVQNASHLPGREFDGSPKLLLGLVKLLAPVRQLSLGEGALGRILPRNGIRDLLRFPETTAQETRRFQIIIEQIAECFLVCAIESDGLLKVLTGSRSVRWRQERARNFGSAAARAPEPEHELRLLRIGGNRLLKSAGRLLIIRHHEIRLARERPCASVFAVFGL
jgi:hypothetical protein